LGEGDAGAERVAIFGRRLGVGGAPIGRGGFAWRADHGHFGAGCRVRELS